MLVGVRPGKDGVTEIHEAEVSSEELYVARTCRVKLGWRSVRDMCHTTCSNGPLVILCSLSDGSIAGIALHDGKVR